MTRHFVSLYSRHPRLLSRPLDTIQVLLLLHLTACMIDLIAQVQLQLSDMGLTTNVTREGHTKRNSGNAGKTISVLYGGKGQVYGVEAVSMSENPYGVLRILTGKWPSTRRWTGVESLLSASFSLTSFRSRCVLWGCRVHTWSKCKLNPSGVRNHLLHGKARKLWTSCLVPMHGRAVCNTRRRKKKRQEREKAIG